MASVEPYDGTLWCSNRLFKAVAKPGIVIRLSDPDPTEALMQAELIAGAKNNETALLTQV